MADTNEPEQGTTDAGTTTDTATTDTTDTATTETSAPTPSPRPRSAASRARRIGGAAVSPRPDAEADSEAAAEAPTIALTKGVKGDKATKGDKAAKNAKATPATAPEATPKRAAKDDADESSRAALTFSVPGWVRWAPGFVFAAVAVVFLTLFAVKHIGGDDPPASTSSTMRQQVLAAAKTCLATLNTYRYDQLEAAETAGVRCTTGKLTDDFKRTVTTVLRKNAPPLKAVQLAKINTAGIESVTKNGKQWTVLAYGQLNITTANTGKQGQIDPFAVVARLQEVKGKWVLSKIDTVSSFSN